MGLLLLFLPFLLVQGQDYPSCNSKIYCQGDLLHTVQMAQLYQDSKSFVDMRLKNPESQTLENFNQLIEDTNNNPTKPQIQQFIDENFQEGNEFEDWVPSDFTENPGILSRVNDEEFKWFLGELVKIWPTLARKIKQEVVDNPGLFSLLPVDNGFIIPGGRFKEFYYWDSYWIIKGLLLSDMHETVKGMLENFLSIVEKYGFVPNGSRVYYLNRSQPPLLSLMVADYIQATQNVDWLKNHIQTLDKELSYWLNNKLIEVEKEGTKYTLAHYDVESGSPRPESYAEDYNTALHLTSEEDKKNLWKELKTGAESGVDFSSRWIIDQNGGINGNLSSLHTRRIIPVDLNSFLCQAFRRLSEFYLLIGDAQKADFWLQKSNSWLQNIEAVLYHKEDGIWYDYDSVLNQPRKYFFPTNFAPLWADAYNLTNADVLGGKAAEYLARLKIAEYKGGVPASLVNTGEQWDLPNAWPPFQALVVMGLDRSGNCEAKGVAKELARNWVTANIIGFNNTGEMFEKYDAETPGGYGGGGEYVVQSGFGWTNGVIFEFVDRFFTESRFG